MTFFNSALENEYKTGTKVKKYTTPKIYKGGKNGTDSWYVYYSYQHPFKKTKTGKPVMQRIKAPTFNLNRKYKSYDKRLIHFTALRDSLENLLKRGLSPFEIQDEINSSNNISANDALDYALSIKKLTVSNKTFKDYESRTNTISYMYF
ncbi:hypothetical protein GO491_09820 [Flavobacteriaceae bacterium Ap0902]|nr:hypothetical protein [Flavobacteriaceae bacterium Ap0902]